MTISFLLWNSVIKSEEEKDTKKKLCEILSNYGAKGAKVENSSSYKSDKGTIFTFEIENIDDEKTICNNIANQQITYNPSLTNFIHCSAM